MIDSREREVDDTTSADIAAYIYSTFYLQAQSQLRKEIDGMLYERTALASKTEEVAKDRCPLLQPLVVHHESFLDILMQNLRCPLAETGGFQ